MPRVADTIRLSAGESLDQPLPIAVNPADGSVFVGGYYSGNILKVDPVTKNVLAKAGGLQYPTQMKVAGGCLYVAGIDAAENAKVFVYDIQLNAVKTILSLWFWIHAIEVDPESRTLYYGTWGKLFAVNLDNDSQTELLSLGNWNCAVSSINLDPPRQKAYLTVYNAETAQAEVVSFDLQTKQILARIPIGKNPIKFDVRYDADRDGDRLFVTQMYSSSITVVNIALNLVERDLPNISWPQRLAVDAEEHRLYVVDNYTDKFHVIDTQSLDLLKTLTPGDDPSGVCFDRARNRVYTANVWTQDIGVIDSLTNSFIERIPLAPATPLDVEVDSEKGTLVVTNGPNGGVFRIESATGKILEKINFYDYMRVDNLYDFPAGTLNIFTGEIETAVAEDGSEIGMVLDEFNQSVAMLNLSTKRLIRHVTPDGSPSSLAIHDGKIIFPYVSNSNLYLGSSDGAEIVSYLLGPSEKSQGIKINPVTQKCYVADYANRQVIVFDLAEKKVLKQIAVGDFPANIGIDPLSNQIYVSNYGSDSISVIDGKSDAVTATVGVGAAPWGVEVNPVTKRVYAVNAGDCSLSVIDAGKNSLMATLTVGKGARYCGVDLKRSKVFVPNQEEGSVTVIEDIVDLHPPVIECPAPIVIENVETENVAVYYAAPTVTDDIDPHPVVTVSPVSGSLFYPGVTPVKVTAKDSEGNESSCSFDVTVKTINLPQPVGDLTAAPLPYKKIDLSWSLSPSPDAVSYRIYMGISEIDYSRPEAVVSAKTTQWTAEHLQDGITYKFVVRTVNDSGIEEKNTSAVSATAYDTPPCLSAAIKSPQNGKKVSGGRLTVTAETACGNWQGIKMVRFEYKPALSGDAEWQIIPAANREHPNPDLTFPYFVHWNVDGLTNGAYQIRAVAVDRENHADPSPSFITVRVDHKDPDSCERVQENGKVERVEKIENQKVNKVVISDLNLTAPAQIHIPAGALNNSETKVTVKLNPVSTPACDTTLKSAGTKIEISLQNGQHDLSG